MRRIVFRVQHGPTDKENCLNMLLNMDQTVGLTGFDCSSSRVNKVVSIYTRSEFSPMLSCKEQINPNNNSKNKPECIKQLFKPLNNMGFLVHQQGAKLSPLALCDGWWCICVSSAGRSSTFKEGHVAVCTRLRKTGRKEASFLVPMKKVFGYCPLIE